MAGYLELLALAGVVAALLWAPIPLASNRPRFWFPLEGFVLVLFAVYGVSRIIDSADHSGRRRIPGEYVIMGLCTLWALYPLLQIVPLPPWLFKSAEPGTAVEPMRAGWQSISIYKFASFEEFLKRAMYIAGFFLLLRMVRERRTAKHIVFALILMGLAQSGYAFYAYPDSEDGQLTGTFTNRNHFALYIAVCLSLAIGIYTYHVRRRRKILNAGNILLAGVAVVFLATMSVAQSKGAVVAFFMALIAVTFLFKDETSRRTTRSLLGLMAATLLVSMFAFDASGLLQRFAPHLIMQDERILQWGDSIRLGLDHWLTGSGAGTYQYAFPVYKTEAYRPLFYNHAHSDYIELFCNEGVIGLTIFLTINGVVLATIIKGHTQRHDPLVRGIAFGTVLAILTILVHGFFDYNLQIPANAMLLFCLMGIGVATINVKSMRGGSIR